MSELNHGEKCYLCSVNMAHLTYTELLCILLLLRIAPNYLVNVGDNHVCIYIHFITYLATNHFVTSLTLYV